MLLVAATPATAQPPEVVSDDFCGAPLAIYSGDVGINPAGPCSSGYFFPTSAPADGTHAACTSLFDHLIGWPCPVDAREAPEPTMPSLPDTRILLPGSTASAGHVGAVDGAPDALEGRLHGLGHDGTLITLHADEDGSAYFSDRFPIEGAGTLRLDVHLPDGTTLTTTYRTLPLA